MRVACVQLNSQDDVAANWAMATRLVRRAAAAGARLVVLPETWNYKGSARGIAAHAEPLDGPSSTLASELAADLGIFLLAGSIYEGTGVADRSYNTSVLFAPNGQSLAVYRKIHLFDVTAGRTVYRESDNLLAGGQIVTAEIEGVTAGLSICYDLRFPELYRALTLRGAVLQLVPSAFTAATGAAHWEVLVRARAIENGCFVVASNQVGFHCRDRECYGHSMIVDPWGRVVARLAEGVGVCGADLDFNLVAAVRRDIPSLQHRRPEVYGAEELRQPDGRDSAASALGADGSPSSLRART